MVEQRSPKPSIWVRILVLLPETCKGFPVRETPFSLCLEMYGRFGEPPAFAGCTSAVRFFEFHPMYDNSAGLPTGDALLFLCQNVKQRKILVSKNARIK